MLKFMRPRHESLQFSDSSVNYGRSNEPVRVPCVRVARLFLLLAASQVLLSSSACQCHSPRLMLPANA